MIDALANSSIISTNGRSWSICFQIESLWTIKIEVKNISTKHFLPLSCFYRCVVWLWTTHFVMHPIIGAQTSWLLQLLAFWALLMTPHMLELDCLLKLIGVVSSFLLFSFLSLPTQTCINLTYIFKSLLTKILLRKNLLNKIIF